MKDYKEDLLEIKLSKQDSKIIMAWLGESRDRNPSNTLLPYFEEILDSLIGSELIIDFTALEYWNSSTITSIVRLMEKINNNNIKTKIQYLNNSDWQVLSALALKTVVTELKMMNNISIIGIDAPVTV